MQGKCAMQGKTRQPPASTMLDFVSCHRGSGMTKCAQDNSRSAQAAATYLSKARWSQADVPCNEYGLMQTVLAALVAMGQPHQQWRRWRHRWHWSARVLPL
mmetsp:Transcript_256/g.600  ORF Transcript_256/g.600 Transcript_256/m.600 type:complete len:101 (-) Transcript_256:118-420(-)